MSGGGQCDSERVGAGNLDNLDVVQSFNWQRDELVTGSTESSLVVHAPRPKLSILEWWW